MAHEPRRDVTLFQRTTSSVVLGGLTGLLALVSVIPILVPLSTRLQSAAQLQGEVQVWLAALEGVRRIELGTAPSELAELLNVEDVIVSLPGDPPAPLPSSMPCSRAPVRVHLNGIDRLVACAERERTGEQLWAMQTVSQNQGYRSGLIVVGLGAVVGLSTALGVLQLLSPLNRIPEGLARVAGGERGVRLTRTGLKEVDELIEHVNAAAQAMEDREDAIRARIEVVQEIARLVAHEVRNPLQTMELLADVMSSEENPEERRALASSLRHEIGILEHVVTRLLSEHKGAALRLTRSEAWVNDLIRRVVTLRQPEARLAQIDLSYRGLDTDFAMHADRALLSRAIENLVANALSFVRKGQGRIEVSASEHGDTIILQVDDNGPGVAPELADRVFQSGVTGREGGTGLGLMFVQGVCAAHGGYAEHVRSPLGGACFRMVLPSHDDQPLTEEVTREDPRRG